MFRFFLCTAVVISAFLISREIISQDIRQTELTRELVSVVDRMLALLRYQSADVYQLCSSCFKKSDLYEVRRFISINNSFSEQWKQACKDALKDADKDAYDEFCGIADYLGMYDLETQMQRLDYTEQALRKIYEGKKDNLLKKKKLCYSLGVFTGIMICMIVI